MTFSLPSRLRSGLAGWLLLASLAVHVPIAVVAFSHSTVKDADFDNYYNIGTRPGRPYKDFPVEFPVGALVTFRTIAPMAGNFDRFCLILVVINFAADLAIAGLLAWGWGIPAAACYAFVMIPLLDLFFLRMDLWSTALATFGVAAWWRERRNLAAMGFVAGAAYKLWPVMFLPLLLAPSIKRGGRIASIATAFAAGVVVLAGWLWVAGPAGLYQVLTFRGARGWEVESSIGAIWMLFDQRSLRLEMGAWRIGATSGPISVLLFVLGVVPCLWIVWRGARIRRVGAGWAGGISTLLVMSALLSPQFACWLAPASGVAWVEKDRRTTVVTGLVIFLTNLIWKD